jgi:hypothetical protein
MTGNLSLVPRTHLPHSSDHFVEFYDDDARLVDSLARFFSTGFDRGEDALIIATEAHRKGLDEALVARGVDVEALTDQNRYTSLDAAETLELFMDEGAPDEKTFQEIFGGIMRRAAADGRTVRIFGEMVAELWFADNVTAALQLEDLWNDLGRSHPMKLFCAYPVRAFSERNLIPLDEVCHRHTHVIAAEGIAI